MNYRVVYLHAARRVWSPGNKTLEGASAEVRALKRRGMTAWVVDEGGRHVPIPGARREPSYID